MRAAMGAALFGSSLLSESLEQLAEKTKTTAGSHRYKGAPSNTDSFKGHPRGSVERTRWAPLLIDWPGGD